jgi:hypothetical protein
MRWARTTGGRLLTGAVAVMLVGGVSLAVAPAASATTVPVGINCDANVTIFAVPGDTIQLTLTNQCVVEADINTFAANGIGNNNSFLQLVSFDGHEGESAGGPGARDWGALRGPVPTTVTVTLLAKNAIGVPLTVGSLLAVIDQASPRFNVYYGGAPVAPTTKDLTVWHQSYARAGADEKCLDGWYPSYAMWANGGKGGWVCNKDTYAYYPNEAVR